MARARPTRKGVAACIAGRAGLEQLSRERVRMEMIKLLVAKHAVPALAVMTETGLLEQVLGGVPLLASFANMVKLEAALALAADPVRRLGALAVSVVEDAERLRERLRLANAEYERLASMADGWWQISRELGRAGGARLLYRLGPRAVHRSRAAGLDARAARRGRCALARARHVAGALDARRRFRSRPPISSRAACRRGRASAPRSRRRRRRGSQPDFRQTRRQLAALVGRRSGENAVIGGAQDSRRAAVPHYISGRGVS